MSEICETIINKPCPFCGCKTIGFQYQTEDREGIPCNAICDECGASGPWDYIQKGHEVFVVKLWNDRAYDIASLEADRRRKEELEATIETLYTYQESMDPVIKGILNKHFLELF